MAGLEEENQQFDDIILSVQVLIDISDGTVIPTVDGGTQLVLYVQREGEEVEIHVRDEALRVYCWRLVLYIRRQQLTESTHEKV